MTASTARRGRRRVAGPVGVLLTIGLLGACATSVPTVVPSGSSAASTKRRPRKSPGATSSKGARPSRAFQRRRSHAATWKGKRSAVGSAASEPSARLPNTPGPKAT